MYGCQCSKLKKCKCLEKKGPSEIIFENVQDVSESLAAVMVACGIHAGKANVARDLIMESFLHYNKCHNRLDALPRKHIEKQNLLSDLGNKCLMNRVEGHLAYTIIKRAFKAFYNGTESCTLRNQYLEQQRIHKQEPLWDHAASKTIQVYASLEQYLPYRVKEYHSKIKKIYKDLYQRMKERAQPFAKQRECICEKLLKGDESERRRRRFCGLVINPLKISLNAEPLHSKETTKKNVQIAKKPSDIIRVTLMQPKPYVPTLSHMSLNVPFCHKCRCVKLSCQCNIEPDTGLVVEDNGAGPFQCQWFRKDRYRCENAYIPYMHECPVDCEDLTCVDEESFICDESICEDEAELPTCSEMSGIESDDVEEGVEPINIMDGAENAREIEEPDEELEANIEEFDSTHALTQSLPAPLSRYPTPRYAGCRVSREPVQEAYDAEKDEEEVIQLEETYSDMLRRLMELAKLGRGPPPPPFDIEPNRDPINLRSSIVESVFEKDEEK